jgi:hypothetical protein
MGSFPNLAFYNLHFISPVVERCGCWASTFLKGVAAFEAFCVWWEYEAGSRLLQGHLSESARIKPVRVESVCTPMFWQGVQDWKSRRAFCQDAR